MKRMLAAALGLSGILASCGSVSVNPGGSGNAYLTGASNLTTSWQLQTDVQDVNTGNTIPAGTYVICDNTNTDIGMNVSFTGSLYSLYVFANGYYTSQTKYLVKDYGGDNSGVEYVTATFGPGVAPLSVPRLGAQAIVVTPVTNVNVKGYTSIRLNTNATQSGSIAVPISNSYRTGYLPVVDCQ